MNLFHRVLFVILALNLTSCKSTDSIGSQGSIFHYADLTKQRGKLSFDVNNKTLVIDSHTTHTLSYCTPSSKFHCVLIDTKTYLAWPRNAPLKTLSSWEYMGQVFKIKKRLSAISCGLEEGTQGVLFSTVAENGYVWNFGVSSENRVFL